jgi:hypothetical protein
MSLSDAGPRLRSAAPQTALMCRGYSRPQSCLWGRRPQSRPCLIALLLTLLTALTLSACSGQSLVDAALAAPSGTPPPSEFGVVLNTPAPTPTAVVIVPRRLTVNVARLSVKPGDPQEIDVNGTPNAFINIIVSLANGDRFNDASHVGAQLDINGTYADKWTIDQLAPGGSVSVQVQDVATGQIDHESFLIDAKPWGGPAPVNNPPIVAFVPYGTPGAAPVAVTPSPSTVPVPTPPFNLATVQPDGTVSGNLQVQSSPSPASIANGGTIRINGYLTDSNGKGVSGARLFAIAHFPGGHSEVWVSPAESGSNGLVWVSAPVTGVSSSATILVDVYMTYNGQSYHGQTSFQVR